MLALLLLTLSTSAYAESTALGVDAARSILFHASNDAPAADRCAAGSERERVACLIDVRYEGDKKAAKIARHLYERTGSVAGILPSEKFDGDYRGIIQLVPHLPVKKERFHLQWLSTSLFEIDDFFKRLGDVKFRYRDLDLRFFRSVKRRTPSAIATGWTVAYNVSGSLFTGPARVRETMFHELFHLNDGARGWWSENSKLVSVYDRIVAKCGMNTKCLTPYAPDGIIVRVKGGTYYAFMPDNGVKEYAADVAKRYYTEQLAVLDDKPVKKPFKCQTPENAEAWALITNEFFGGIDRVPPCK